MLAYVALKRTQHYLIRRQLACSRVIFKDVIGLIAKAVALKAFSMRKLIVNNAHNIEIGPIEQSKESQFKWDFLWKEPKAYSIPNTHEILRWLGCKQWYLQQNIVLVIPNFTTETTIYIYIIYVYIYIYKSIYIRPPHIIYNRIIFFVIKENPTKSYSS